MKIQGFEVFVPASADVVVPWRCVGCCEPCEATVLVPRDSGASSFVRAPMCPACLASGARRASRRNAATVGALVLGLLSGAVTTSVLWLPLGLGAALALAASVSLAMLLARRSLSTQPPVIETAVDPQVGTTLLVARADVASAIADASGGTVRGPAARWTPELGLVGGWAGLAALVGAGGALWLATTGVVIDNAFPGPVDVTVDDRPVMRVPPNVDGQTTRAIRVRPGDHTLGYRVVGSAEPEHTVRVQVSGGRDLYVPGARARHVLVTSFYAAEASRAGAPSVKVLPRAEYTADIGDVDNWFRPNPAKITVKSHETPQRIALVRDADCTALVALGCDDLVVADFVRCREKAAGADAAFDACVAAVTDSCPAARPRNPPGPPKAN